MNADGSPQNKNFSFYLAQIPFPKNDIYYILYKHYLTKYDKLLSPSNILNNK